MYPQFGKIVDISPSSYKGHVHVSFDNELQPKSYMIEDYFLVINASTKGRIFVPAQNNFSFFHWNSIYECDLWPLWKWWKTRSLARGNKFSKQGEQALSYTVQGSLGESSPLAESSAWIETPSLSTYWSSLCQLIKEGCVVQEWISVSPLPLHVTTYQEWAPTSWH